MIILKNIRMLRKHEGFTLIELIVILAILSIIITLALYKLNDIVARSEQAVDSSNVSYLNSVTRVYRVETGNWPSAANYEDELVSDYLKEFPISPTGGSYIYDVSTNEFSYSAP